MTADGRVALVTGGSHGIGRAIVQRLLAEGYRVAFWGGPPTTSGPPSRRCRRSGPTCSDVPRVPYANVVCDLDRNRTWRACTTIASVGVVTCGHYGDWDYNWGDDAIVSGWRAAGTIAHRFGVKCPLRARGLPLTVATFLGGVAGSQ